MSQHGKSTPKMRRAFTPRVKSALNLHDTEPKRALFFTDQKNQNYNSINPQKVENHISKKLNLQISPQKPNKIDIAYMNTDTGSPIKLNPFIEKAPIAKYNNFHHANDKNIGRNIQWQNNNNKQPNNPTIQQNQQNKLSRCMSATIRSTYISKSQRTDKIKQQRKEFDEKFSVAFDYLVKSNQNYLNEKISMCNQKARPKEESFKIKRPSLNTANKDYFSVNEDKHRLDIEPQNEKMSILMSESKVCGNSTAHEFHKGTHGKRADLAQWGEGFKLQGPIYNATTSHNAYPNHGEFQKMVPIAVWNEHPLGMKHKQTTTNSKFYKGQFTPRADLATWNNLNPVANDFSPDRGTTYKQQHGSKQKQPIQTWPMPEHKLITSQGKFDTQMKTSMVNFSQHQLNDENKCNCGRSRH